MGYKRSANNEFNAHLERMRKQNAPKPPQTNIEKSQARLDAWLAEQEAYAQRGEKSPWVLAMQKNLDEYSKPHGNAWWAWTIVKNRAYRIGVDVWFDFIKPIRYIDWIAAVKHIFRKRY
jgi:hypothetical protein